MHGQNHIKFYLYFQDFVEERLTMIFSDRNM